MKLIHIQMAFLYNRVPLNKTFTIQTNFGKKATEHRITHFKTDYIRILVDCAPLNSGGHFEVHFYKWKMKVKFR